MYTSTSGHKGKNNILAVSNDKAPQICIIGAGNVASHLAVELDKTCDIIQIYSHTLSNAQRLATTIGKKCIATDSIESITDKADFYIISVKDDHIARIAESTPDTGIWAHTSGSIPMSVFEKHKTRFGVIYPLQTFSKNVPLDIKRVPFFIEGNDEVSATMLTTLAHQISDVVKPANSDRRKALHIAAVFACNFVNFMWIQADDLLSQTGLDITYMKPLLEETLNKLNSVKPIEAQTGPARRCDTKIINEHLSNLSGEKHDIYKLISQLIINRYNEQNRLRP